MFIIEQQERVELEARERHAPTAKRLLKDATGPVREAAKPLRKALDAARKEVERLEGVIQSHQAKSSEVQAQAEALEKEILDIVAAGGVASEQEERLASMLKQLSALDNIILGLTEGHLARAKAAKDEAEKAYRAKVAEAINGLTAERYELVKAAFLALFEEAEAWDYVIESLCGEFGVSWHDGVKMYLALPLKAPGEWT